ncbi:MAG: helicase HerA domain-containing protein [Pyrinomonadaceae bacterium]
MSSHLAEVFAADEKEILKSESQRIFGELIQLDQYVGDVYSISYDSALVQIHDKHRQNVGGIPSLCFLIATRVDPRQGTDFMSEDASIILLRVMDAAPLPNAAEAERIRVEVAQRVSGDPTVHWDDQGAMDGITQNLLSFAGVKCRVIGTFYLNEAGSHVAGHPSLQLRFGSDLSNYYPNRGLKVYKPNGTALARIVNYRDPDRLHTQADVNVKVGDVRYASTNRAFQGVNDVPVSITPTDLLTQKTALFGMTRSGKSNTTKIIIKSVFDLRYESVPRTLRVGQLVFDANGEYANENTQDATGGRSAAAIKNLRDAHPSADKNDVVTYGITAHPHDPERRLMLLNFYLDGNLQTGKQTIDAILADDKGTKFIGNFRQIVFDPPAPTDRSATIRYNRHVLCYRALLNKAGLTPPPGLQPQVSGLFSKELRDAMRNSTSKKNAAEHIHAGTLLESKTLSWDQMAQICERLYDFMEDDDSGYRAFDTAYAAGSSTGDSWADDNLKKIGLTQKAKK